MNANEAADLIESLQAENAAYRAENERLAANLKDMRDQNQTISEKNRELRITLDEREKNSKATQKAMLDEIAKIRNDLTAKTALLDAAIAEQETLQRAFAESQRRERAAVEERDTLMRRYHEQVEIIRRRIDAGGLTEEEARLLDDLMLPRQYDRRGPQEARKGE